jgi:hypothetical protein
MTSLDDKSDHATWQHHITQWQTSGLSQADYCRQQSLRTKTFSYWKCKLLPGSERAEPKLQSGFVKVQLAEQTDMPPSPSLTLWFPGGIHLTGIARNNLSLIKSLLEVLR